MPARLDEKKQAPQYDSLLSWMLHKRWPALLLIALSAAWFAFVRSQNDSNSNLLNQVAAAHRLRLSRDHARNGDWITAGQNLSTAIDGWAIIRLGRGRHSHRLRMFANTALHFSSTKILELQRGKIWIIQDTGSAAQHVRCQNQMLHCQSPQACDFVVLAADNYCSLQVYSGQVAVQTVPVPTVAETSPFNNERLITAGQKQNWRQQHKLPAPQKFAIPEDQKIWQARYAERPSSLLQFAQDLLP